MKNDKLSLIADIVNARMDELKLTQNGLARVAKMNQSTIYKIVHKETNDITLTIMMKLAKGLRLSLSQLLGEAPIASDTTFYPKVITPPSPEAIAVSMVWDSIPQTHRADILSFIRVWGASKAASTEENSQIRHKSA